MISFQKNLQVDKDLSLTSTNLDLEISNLNKQIDEIILEYEEVQQITEKILLKAEQFKLAIEEFFQMNKSPFNENQLNKITRICRKANENEDFQLLLQCLKQYNEHPKIFFKKPVTLQNIPGDDDCFDTNEDITSELIIKEINSKIEHIPKRITVEKHDEVKNEIKNLVEESLFLYNQEHKIDKPFKILQKLLILKEKYDIDPKLGNFVNQIFEDNAFHFREIKKEYEYLKIFLQETESKDWIHEKSKGKIHVYYKQPKDIPTCSLKFEAELEIPMKNISALIYECDLMHLWVPFLKISKTMKKINKACKAFYIQMDLPFISNRESYCMGYGVNRLEENGTYLIIARTIDQEFDFLKKNNITIPEKSKFVKMDIHYFIIEILPLNEKLLKVKIITNMNPKLKVIPYSLLNFMTRKFGIKIFKNLLNKATKNFEKSPWYKLMLEAESQDFYQWIENIIIPFIDRQK